MRVRHIPWSLLFAVLLACAGPARGALTAPASPGEHRKAHRYAYRILKAISGQHFGARDYLAWECWLRAQAGQSC